MPADQRHAHRIVYTPRFSERFERVGSLWLEDSCLILLSNQNDLPELERKTTASLHVPHRTDFLSPNPRGISPCCSSGTANLYLELSGLAVVCA